MERDPNNGTFHAFFAATLAPISFCSPQKDDRFEVEAEVPGVPKESINVEVDNNVVYLNIERKEEQEEGGEDTQWHRTERRFGQVKRAFRLPETADTERVDGSVENGILRLNIPKRARDQGTRRRIALH